MKAVLFLIFFLWFFCYPFSVSKGRFSACSCFSFSLFSETRRNWAVEGKAWKVYLVCEVGFLMTSHTTGTGSEKPPLSQSQLDRKLCSLYKPLVCAWMTGPFSLQTLGDVIDMMLMP
ncbi:hypothetical protein LY78DRAFT_80109 [Colletotrichum sublineola]|nr:hypothetical protein LY78DRAFT_80109 [Colletotrichum sublineola]